MIPGVRGRLISASFARSALPDLVPALQPPHRAIERWSVLRAAQLGPASTVRAIADTALIPLLDILGYIIEDRTDEPSMCRIAARGNDRRILAVACGWGVPLDAAWRAFVLRGIAAGVRWALCTNAIALRIVDAEHTWSRQFLEFELDALGREPEARTLCWTLARAEAVGGREPLLDLAVERSARYGVEVCRALGAGVLDALTAVLGALAATAPRPRADLEPLFEQSLTILYRVLFLLFAEARGLVPVWHPIYRDRYTIEAIVSTLLDGKRYRGVWHALQAISRLAHAGCRAGELRVTPFNGRLFSPLHTPAGERGRIGDQTIGRALLAVSTTPTPAGRARIVYRDLDVEQLGAVYEHVLDFEPIVERRQVLLNRTGDLRKASGTFYTPRSVTSYVVRRALAPLVANRSAADILALRVVDPAMGSGAFLVAACRYLASACEHALVRDGEWHEGDVTSADRIALRRDIAQRCLYGADLNPMAVQLGRLSLWLATLASDKPLTFLDHHLVTGDSLVGASPEDVARQPPGGRKRRTTTLPLFESDGLAAALRTAVPVRLRLALEPDDHVDIVRRKEAALAALREGRAIAGWRTLLDLWCACWCWDNGDAPDGLLFRDLAATVAGGGGTLPDAISRRWLTRAAEIAGRRRFLHWAIEFPEVFHDDAGARLPDGGFDAVLGNPPWDMVRGDSGDAGTRARRGTDARQLVDFVRASGIYRCDGRAHVNRYQLFVERALQLTRPGGRIGLVLPAGLASDTGCAALRRHLFAVADVDSLAGLDNRGGIFPIHRSVRFVLMTATTGRPTSRIACRFGVRDPEQLDAVDDTSHAPPLFPVAITRGFLSRASGEDDLGIPELTTAMDLAIVERIAATVPWLGSEAGWHVEFGRELNASDDREAFRPASVDPDARAVLEGKQIEPFRVRLDECRYELRPEAVVGTRVPRRPRLAYRDVASATNRLTLIAAIVPARAVTTHTLFCLRTMLELEAQLVLCALLNSYVANYLIRLRVNTHVTASLMARLPVPMVRDGDGPFEQLAAYVKRLMQAREPIERLEEHAELQALVARLYGVTREQFSHVLDTFPLLGADVRAAALTRFDGGSSLRRLSELP